MLKRYALNCPSCNEENSVYWFASEPEKPFCNNCEEEINLQDVREKHLFSTEDIQRMIRKALDDFIAEIESNRNRMMLRLSGELRAIGRNHIPPTWESIASTLQNSLEKWGEIAGQQALGAEFIGVVAGERGKNTEVPARIPHSVLRNRMNSPNSFRNSLPIPHPPLHWFSLRFTASRPHFFQDARSTIPGHRCRSTLLSPGLRKDDGTTLRRSADDLPGLFPGKKGWFDPARGELSHPFVEKEEPEVRGHA